MSGQQPDPGLLRRAFKRLTGRVFELLEGWLLTTGAALLAAMLAAVARWGGGLTEIQRAALRGSALTVGILTTLFLISGATIYVRRRGADAEVRELVDKVRGIAGEAERVYGPRRDIRHTPNDFMNTMQGLHASLVRAVKFRKRGELFNALKALERTHGETPPDQMWNALRPHLEKLEKWADYADHELLLRPPPSRDPLGS